ncbi:MAG: hypothetical protein ABI600_15840 [Luteolibacter sp.]
MNFLKSALLTITSITSGFAGSLNVVHLGPPQEINLEVKSGDNAQKFTLAYQSASGPFILPNKKSSLHTIGDQLKSLNIGATKAGRIAVLYPKADTYVWKLYDSKPTLKKASLRVINLTAEAAILTIAGKKVEIGADADTAIEEVNKSPIRIIFEDRKKQEPHLQEEPSAVIAFIYKNKDGWRLFYINDV